MPTYRCQSTMVRTSGIPADATVNTFHVFSLVGVPNFADITDAWQTFMRAIYGYFSGAVAASGHSLKVYDLADPEPRAPKSDLPWSFTTAPSGDTLPSEVALCLSYQGARISGEDQRRRRGRMFLGPLRQSGNVSGRPTSDWLTDLPGQFQSFVDDLNAAGVYFVVRSRVDDDDVQVTNCWVDNAWDIQRRRGLAPTSRVTDTVSQVVA